jgi:uncharacterized SAM-binding protein YcdF (DUF218 family)
VVEFVKNALIPGSTPFLLLGLGLGVTLLYCGRRFAQWGRVWLTALAALYLVLSLPAVSSALIASMSGPYGSIRDAGDARGARVVVAIGNGAVTYAAGEQALHQLGRRTAYIVLETARLYRLLAPEWVVSSGGIPDSRSQQRPESEIMRDALVTLGVPADRIVLESGSRNTAEQLAGIARVAADRHASGPLVLVTSPAHARRVMLAARRHGVDAVLSTSDQLVYADSERAWLPSFDALRGSESALYEGMAVAYYWFRGTAR